MHLADIDYLALQKNSLWHKASVLSKLFFTVIVIYVVVVSNQLSQLAVTLAFLLALLFVAGIPLRRFVHLLAYPALFATVFALSRMGNSWTEAALTITKSLTAAASLILLITTCGALAVLSYLRLFLPALIADTFFLTYRSFFILLGQVDSFFTVVKVKGGYSPLRVILNLRNTAAALGVLLIHSLETSERMHKALALRGYRSGIIYAGKRHQFTKYDLGPVLAGIVILLGAVMA